MAASVCEATVEDRDAKGQFNKGWRGGPGGKKQGDRKKGSIDGLRTGLLDHWANVNHDKILDKVAKEKPVEYVKCITAIAPKQNDAIIHRQIVMCSFTKEPPASWTPDGGHEDDDVVDSSVKSESSTTSTDSGIGANAT